MRKKIRNEIAQEVVAGIKEKPCAHNGVMAIARKAAGQSVKQNWDCSQIENEEDEEENDWARRKTRWKYNGMKDAKVGGDLGTKKDGRKLLAVGSHAK